MPWTRIPDLATAMRIVELASRQLRTKEPEDIRELEPVIGRLVLGVMGAAPPRTTAA